MTDIDLKPFCSTDEYRPSLHAPFSIGEWTYATDGRILIRVPRRGDVPESPGAPDTPKVMADMPTDGYAPICPVTLEPNDRRCPDCDGRGYEHDCPDCDCVCEGCDGSGSVKKWPLVGIDGVAFDGRYIELLQTLPGIVVATAQHPSKGLPTAFRFDGGEGLLMPTSGSPYGQITAREHQPEPAA